MPGPIGKGGVNAQQEEPSKVKKYNVAEKEYKRHSDIATTPYSAKNELMSCWAHVKTEKQDTHSLVKEIHAPVSSHLILIMWYLRLSRYSNNYLLKI